MRLKYLSGALLASAMLLAPAYAQTTPPASTPPKAASPAPKADQWRASKLIGLNVYNAQNEKLGDISEILVDKSGKIEGVVIGVGGFLGMGRHDVMVSFDKLKFVDEPVRAAAPTTQPPAGQPGTRTTDTPRADTKQPGDTAARETPRTDTTGSTGTTATARRDNRMPDHAVLNATKDELKAMPKFEM